ncbi:hypothetical protein BLA29_013471 [Euroglyphus maynei]|uniref:Uncharacterized protein n=1 Tax=Euroglyphus maynei TaxID=6958 RepID=A0A1Y3BCF3_EURMA|nr:hypothetical protein BLA29_013471 [Euroglyphus maynei]
MWLILIILTAVKIMFIVLDVLVVVIVKEHHIHFSH